MHRYTEDSTSYHSTLGSFSMFHCLYWSCSASYRPRVCQPEPNNMTHLYFLWNNRRSWALLDLKRLTLPATTTPPITTICLRGLFLGLMLGEETSPQFRGLQSTAEEEGAFTESWKYLMKKAFKIKSQNNNKMPVFEFLPQYQKFFYSTYTHFLWWLGKWAFLYTDRKDESMHLVWGHFDKSACLFVCLF